MPACATSVEEIGSLSFSAKVSSAVFVYTACAELSGPFARILILRSVSIDPRSNTPVKIVDSVPTTSVHSTATYT